MNKRLKCNVNGDFTILVISDPQCEKESQWKETSDELEILVKRTNPDFVLINGDMETNNNISADGWNEFIKPLESRGISWSTTNGNHDPFDENIYQMYISHAGCLNSKVEEDDEFYDKERPMNYYIPVYASDSEKVVFAVYGMDSGTQNKAGWEGFTKNQTAWYKRCSDELKALNSGKPVTSLMCCHIPFDETRNMEVLHGVINEIAGFTSPENNRGVFNAIKEQNDVKIAVFGHSHKINRVGIYRDTLLCYAGKISIGSYHDEFSRGGRVIKFNQTNPEKFITSWIGALPTSKDQPEVYLYNYKNE